MKIPLLPINILVIFLQILALWSAYAWSGTDIASWLVHVRNFSLLFLSGFAVRALITHLIDPAASFRIEHRLITTLILFLLFDALSPWWVFLVLGIITEICQYFFRTPSGPLFNPAALGTLIMSLFGFLPSWWGTNPAPRIPVFGEELSLALFLTITLAGYVVHRYRKLPLSIVGMVSFALLYALLFQQNPFYITFEGTLLFFFLVMVPEPKTSSVLRKEQMISGALIGALVAFGLYFHFTEAYVTALLIANLYTGRRFLMGLLSSPARVDSSP